MRYKKNQMEILWLKEQHLKFKKNSLDGLNRRMKMTEGRVNEPQAGRIEMIQPEQQRDNRLEKMNRNSGIYRTKNI